MLEIFLERAPRGHEPVPVGLVAAGGSLALEHYGHAERLPSESPCGLQRLNSLPRIFDDVEDETQVDHVGGCARTFGGMMWIPAKSGETLRDECSNVFTLPAAVIKNRAIGTNNAKSHHKLHRLREIAAHDSGPVPGDLHMLLVGWG